MNAAPTPLRRFLRTTLAWGVLVGAGPGILDRDGSTLLAVVGLALWAHVVRTPLGERPRWALFAEWAGHTLGGCGIWAWFAYVLPASLIWVGGGFAVYILGAGALLRRLEPRLSLVLALPCAWMSVEALRSLLPLPIGAPWLRLGHHAHHHLWLSGSARVWGVEGLGIALAALAGLLLSVFLERRARPREVLLGLTPLALGFLLAALVPAPVTREGPRILVVQPAFTQERRVSGNSLENFETCREMTARALADLTAAGEADPDLVAWGESMTYVDFATPGLDEAAAGGLTFQGHPLDPGAMRRQEANWIGQGLFGARTGVGFAPGTWFLGGGNSFWPLDGEIGLQVSMALFDPQGQRVALASKKHLAPGGETMFGLERIGWIRDLLMEVAGYLPSFMAGEGGVMEFTTRDGETWAFDVGVCYDNGYLDVFLPGVVGREPPVDFHLVASNEAWFRESHEMDQMVAFSRLIALSTGRGIVRAANSGVSVLIGPDGVERGRIEVDGRDRAVPGTKLFEVPVPLEAASVPFYARFHGLIVGLTLALGLVALLARRDRGNPA